MRLRSVPFLLPDKTHPFMPFLSVNGVRLHYTDEGSGRETLVFSHGVLWSGAMFEAQARAFGNRYRIIRYDHRGQGQSEAPRQGYDMDTLTDDAAAIIQQLVGKPVHFVGLSTGGFVGMRLAARRPELVRSLTLLETTCDPELPETRARYRLLNTLFFLFGPKPLTKPVMRLLFGQKFLNDPNRAEERCFWEAQLQANTRTVTRAVRGVIERSGIADELPHIICPTLVLVGTQDVATVPAKAERIAKFIGEASLQYLDGAGHSSSVEEPAQVNAALEAFLSRVQKPVNG